MEVDGPVIGWNSWRHFSWLTMASDSSANLIVNRNLTGHDLDGTIAVTNAGAPTGMMENYSLTETILISAVLLFIIVGTVVGNILVCVAVCLVRRLRRPCNYLLVSLAVSDLCVALLVMPMALVYEVLGTWPFGARACDTWVAFDVLSCTASILNLCMISVDRYWAITRPLDYGVKRTPARMISCVALVWISSACISLPPLLVLGNEHGPSPPTFTVNNNNVSHHQSTAAGPTTTTTTTTTTTANWIELLMTKTTSDDSAAGLQDYQCQVCQEFGYQIYATLGSFYIPLAVMAAVYYQIFQAAKRIVDEEKKAQSHLLMTRTNSSCTTTKQKTTTTTTTTSISPPPGQQQKVTSSSLLVHPAQRHHQPVLCNSAAMVVVQRHSDRQVNEERNSNKETNSSLPESNNSPPPLSHNESSWTNNCNGNNYPVTTHWPDNHSKPQQQQQQPKTVDISRNSLSVSMDNVTGEMTIPVVLSHPIDALSYAEQQKEPGVLIHQSGLNPLPMRHRRNRSHRLTHGRASRVRLRFALNKERKASTTLGIIMSAFTLCWFPFFVLALVRPFMSHQTASLVIPHWLSSLFLWLGYANSFLNPVIYATTNKDFRLPFREILCLRCKSLNSVMREDFYQSQYGNNQQLMGNNNKGGLMATGGHPSSSPSSHAKLQGGHHHKSRRRRRYSTDGLADDEQQNERIMSHQQDRQPNASAISKVDVSVSATGDEEEEDTVTDYGLLSSGHRISSSSATAFL